MTISRRSLLQVLAAAIAVGAAGFAAFQFWPHLRPFEGALAIWRGRLRVHAELERAAVEHYATRDSALEFLRREMTAHTAGDSLEQWVASFEAARQAEFAAGETVYLKGWPFAPVEVAVLSLGTAA